MHLKMSSGTWRSFCLGLNVFVVLTVPPNDHLVMCKHYANHALITTHIKLGQCENNHKKSINHCCLTAKYWGFQTIKRLNSQIMVGGLFFLRSIELLRVLCRLNSSWPSDATWRFRAGSTLAQVMVFCLKAPEPTLTDYQLGSVTHLILSSQEVRKI